MRLMDEAAISNFRGQLISEGRVLWRLGDNAAVQPVYLLVHKRWCLSLVLCRVGAMALMEAGLDGYFGCFRVHRSSLE